MTTTLAFRDHEGFHRAAIATVMVGAGGGLVAHLASLAGISAGVPAGVVGGVLGVVVGAAATGGDRATRLGRGLGMVAVGAVAGWVATRSGSPAAAIAALAITVAAVISLGLRGTRRLAALGVAGAAATLAWMVATRVHGAAELATTPGWVVSALAGAGFAAASLFGLLGRHVAVIGDPVAAAVATLPRRLDAEVAGLVARGQALWVSTGQRLAEGDPNRQLVADGVIRLVDVAHRWAAVDAERGDVGALDRRMAELDGRIEASTDDVTRGQYREARAALAEQRRYLDSIGQRRDRVLARMHNYVAGMEKFRLAVVNLETASASRLAADARPMVAMLEELGADMDACGAALGEVDSVTAPIAALPAPAAEAASPSTPAST